MTDNAIKGIEVVLLVDDEESVRRILRKTLEGIGYKVLDAGDGLEGLAVCRTYPGSIDILLSDVTMPKLGGRELAAGARELRPAMKILLMSGYSEEIVLDNTVLRGTAFLQKPFTSMALRQKLRAELDSVSPMA